jgi:hypothetical protein
MAQSLCSYVSSRLIPLLEEDEECQDYGPLVELYKSAAKDEENKYQKALAVEQEILILERASQKYHGS